MTIKEYAAKTKPELIDPTCVRGMRGCPSDYGFLPDPEWCKCNETTCTRCWNREMFAVEQIIYNDDNNIVALSIRNKTTGQRVFLYDAREKAQNAV